MEKKNVIIFIDWFYPAFKAGGPIRSVHNLIEGLSAHYNFFLITSNCELDGEILDVESNKWINKGSYQLIYLSKEQQNISNYKGLANEVKAEIVYLNSLYSYNFTLKPYRAFKNSGRRLIIAARGMLGQGALSIKPLKKKIFLAFSKRFFFEKKHTIWQATSDQEARDIHEKIGQQTMILKATNFPPPICKRDLQKISKERGKLNLVFFSRILPIKNLHFILEVLDEMKTQAITLNIYGPIEDQDYWEACLKHIESNKNISYKGTTQPDEVSTLLQKYHYLVQPSDNENFGHSIVESLCSGVPVLISKNTPWQNLEESNTGHDLDLDKKQWLEKLNTCVEISSEEYSEQSSACIQFAKEKVHSDNLIQDYQKLFYV